MPEEKKEKNNMKKILPPLIGLLTSFWVVYSAQHIYNTFVAPGFSLPTVKYHVIWSLLAFLSLTSGGHSLGIQLMVFNTDTSDDDVNFRKSLTHSLTVSLMALSALLMTYAVRWLTAG